MSQTSFINGTIDPAVAKKPDRADHVHIISRTGSSSGDATFSYDPAKITSKTIARSMFAQMMANSNDLTGP